ncbi:MAG TPA: phytanoyl-CoA dioxygenase family protein [Gemmatimonadaceae bacterium]|nr:phytanoyl-CoA dioxygenase family protein [Gemmatimonadaceae bacterium]
MTTTVTENTRGIVGPSVVADFKREGYYLHRGMFSKATAAAAADWMKAQDPEKVAKSWTEQEPAVPLAVYSVIHKGDDPIAQISRDPDMLAVAAELMGEPVYIWSSKVNIKSRWAGTAEYYHQDLVYWKDRGYPKDDMLSCMVFLEPHSLRNACLHVIPGTHTYGYIEHQPFVNINGLAKYMVPPATLDKLYEKHGLLPIEAEPGDVLYFHTSLVHGSSHNISNQGRMIVLAQLNTVGNEPTEVSQNARLFNLRRAEFEVKEAERRHKWFKEKYEKQLATDALTFSAPIPEEEKGKY